MKSAIKLAAVLALASGASAWGDAMVVIDPGMALGDVHTEVHEDDAPWAGWAELTVTNNGTEPWGDFHFNVFEVTGDPVNVDYKDAAGGGFDPVSSQSGLTWQISPDGSAIDLFFYGDPVLPGETAQFNVYNVNPDQVTFFGTSYYPTPVPEPATLALMSLGGLLMFRRRSV